MIEFEPIVVDADIAVLDEVVNARVKTEIVVPGDITIEPLTATENGVTTAPSGKAYSPVTVLVPTQGATLAALIDNSITEIVIPYGTTKIASNKFAVCTMLRSVVIPETVMAIDTQAFYSCSNIESITIPNRVSLIGQMAFRGCTTLKTVVVGSAVSRIAAQAFYGLTSAENIRFLSTTPPNIDNRNAFGNLPTTCVIHVPTGSLSAYQAATNMPDPNTYTYAEDE